MTTIISRDKKHLHLGRLMTITAAKIQYLGEIKRKADSLLFQFSQLDSHYSECEEMGLPSDILDKLMEERATLKQVAQASIIIHREIDKTLGLAIRELDTYDDQLKKAEENYKKLVKKTENKIKDALKSSVDVSSMIATVSENLLKTEGKATDKHN